MKRMHVHVAVANLDESILFYSGMFASAPTVRKSDYAKWQLEDPCVNFAISQRGALAGLRHLGIQVDSADELGEMQERLARLQPEVEKEDGVTCCYAKSDKYWLTDPSGIAWETYRTLGSIPVFGTPGAVHLETTADTQTEACCEPSATSCCPPKDERTTNKACCS